MPLTLEQILAHEERLKQQIAENQSLLEACQLLRSQMTKGEIAVEAPKASVESTSASETAPPIPARKIHPELAAIAARRGNKGDIVAWAIRQMTDDYSVGDIVAVLRREGGDLSSSEVSVVLTRLKRRGEIEEIRHGFGRKGSLFRKPNDAISTGDESATHQRGTHNY